MKKHYMLRFLFSVLFFSYGLFSFADICSSMSDGNWSQGEIWSCGHPPGCGDTIYINHVVNVDTQVNLDESSGCNTPTFIVITATGNLHFINGQKLNLACGSGISIESGGQLTANTYSGSNNFINICGSHVWIASDGPQSGPTVYGSGLPIELVSFNAYRNQEVVNLEWITATEINNDFFTVERSTDAYTFNPILIVDGAGNSSVLLNYSEKDNHPLASASYYRLKQTDYDGNYSYSRIVEVNSVGSNDGIMVYPNPADLDLNILMNGFDGQNVILFFRDITGKEVMSTNIIPSGDHYVHMVAISGQLAAGTYFVTAITEKDTYTQKLVVK